MAKGPKTQAVVDLLVSSGSFSFWQTQKFSIQSGTYAYFMIYNICTGFSFAITNNLGDVLFRGEAVSRVSDSDRTSPTTWVHFRSLSPEIIEKNQSPRHEAFLRA